MDPIGGQLSDFTAWEVDTEGETEGRPVDLDEWHAGAEVWAGEGGEIPAPGNWSWAGTPGLWNSAEDSWLGAMSAATPLDWASQADAGSTDRKAGRSSAPCFWMQGLGDSGPGSPGFDWEDSHSTELGATACIAEAVDIGARFGQPQLTSVEDASLGFRIDQAEHVCGSWKLDASATPFMPWGMASPAAPEVLRELPLRIGGGLSAGRAPRSARSASCSLSSSVPDIVHDRRFRRVLAHLCLDECDSFSMANTTWALAQLQLRHVPLLDALAAKASRTLGSASREALPLLLTLSLHPALKAS